MILIILIILILLSIIYLYLKNDGKNKNFEEFTGSTQDSDTNSYLSSIK
jgi:hypothetical protein